MPSLVLAVWGMVRTDKEDRASSNCCTWAFAHRISAFCLQTTGQYRVFSAAGFFLIFLAKLSRRNWQLTSAEVACDLRLSRDLPRPYNGIIVALVVTAVIIDACTVECSVFDN